MSSARGRQAGYGATVFVTSAVLMVLEIAAGRLIAPYVGVSLYTWTSVIGVVLAGLSLGNWLGGRWADSGGAGGAVAVSLIAAALASFAVLALLTVVAPLIQQQDFSLLSASFLLVLSLFFLPAMLLGLIAPLLTTLALRQHPQPGHVVGRMHALAALGSIVGTFAAGYWLIQYFGTRAVISACAVVLALVAVPFVWRARRVAALLGMAAAGAALAYLTESRQGFLTPCDEESQYYCIRVVDATPDVPFGRARALILDHLLHSINHFSQPELLAAPYVHLMDELAQRHLGPRAPAARFFFAGGGAYTQPRALRARTPGAELVIAELDPRVTAVAARRLWVAPAGMRVLHTDARVALRQWRGERFDVIVGDVFHDIAVPYHLTTREYVRLVKSRLRADGLYLLNVVDAYPDPLLVKSIVKTLQGQFRHVQVYLDEIPAAPRRVTFVIRAGDGAAAPQHITAQAGIKRQWQAVTARLWGQGTPWSRLPELSDDYVPVERLVASLFVSNLGH